MQRIVDWLAESFKRDEGIDLLKDKQALQRLTETAEKAKIELSSLTQTNIRYITTLSLSLHPFDSVEDPILSHVAKLWRYFARCKTHRSLISLPIGFEMEFHVI